MARVGQQAPVDGYQVLIAFDNFALASNGATAEADSEQPTGNLGAGNLTNPALDLPWRSGSFAALYASGVDRIKVVHRLGNPRSVSWISLHRSNLRNAFRVKLYQTTDAVSSPVYVSPWTDPIVRASVGDFPTFSSMPWTLGPPAATIDRRAAERRLDNVAHIDASYESIRRVEIEVDVGDGANGPADYVQWSYPIIAELFRPLINMQIGWDISVNDRSRTHRTDSGALLGRRESSGKILSFGLPYLERSEAFSRILEEWAARYGLLGRVFVWAEPAHRINFFQQALLGTVTRLPSVAMARLEWPAATGFQIEESE